MIWQQADAVHHARAEDVEAAVRLVDHGLDGLLGHARVMLELHRRHVAAVVAVAHSADEAADGTHARVAGAQRGDFLLQVEVVGLDRNARAGHGRIVASR